MVASVRSRLDALRSGRTGPGGLVAGHRPSTRYLNDLLQQVWAEQTDQRALDTQIEAMLDDKHDLGLPEVGLESEEVRGGWAMELVTRIRQWWPRSPNIRIPTMGAGDDPENFSNDLEEALNALIQVQSKAHRGPGGTFFDEVKTDVVAFGRGYGAVLPAPRLAAGYPAPAGDVGDPDEARRYFKQVESWGKGHVPPLVLRHLPARRVYPLFDDEGLAECFWVTTERAWSVLERADARGVSLPEALAYVDGDDEARIAEPLTVVNYANRFWRAELIGTPRSWPPTEANPDWLEDVEPFGAPFPHWLSGRIPIAYFPGMTTPLSSSAKKTISAVYQLRHIILMLDRLASMKATVQRVWAWPTPVLKTSLLKAGLIEAGDDGRPVPIELAPGLMMTLWGDEEISFLTHRGTGPEQNELLVLLRQQFDRLGLPAVEHGQGDVSGYAFAQMRAAARGKWSAIETGLVQGWEDLAWIELEYLKQMPATVWVPTVDEAGWRSFGRFSDRRSRERGAYLRVNPARLREKTFLLNVKLEPDRSLDLIANAQAGNALKLLGIPDRIIWEEVLGFENSTQIRFEQMMDELRASPGWKEVVFGEALRQGRILLARTQEGDAEGLTAEELTQYTPDQIEAMLQAGLIAPEVAQQVLSRMAGGIPGAQIAGALTQGAAPALTPPGPYQAPGGAPGQTPLQGGVASVVRATAGPLGAVGGGMSPAVTAAPAAPRPLPGRGRAAGQSRRPTGPQRG